jgi:hypothetical protein
MKLYIAVLNTVPSFMVPTLVAHSVINAHILMQDDEQYNKWLTESFKKVVLSVNQKEFDKISALDTIVHLGHENSTLGGIKSCAVVRPYIDELPNVLKFAKMWKP